MIWSGAVIVIIVDLQAWQLSRLLEDFSKYGENPFMEYARFDGRVSIPTIRVAITTLLQITHINHHTTVWKSKYTHHQSNSNTVTNQTHKPSDHCMAE